MRPSHAPIPPSIKLENEVASMRGIVLAREAQYAEAFEKVAQMLDGSGHVALAAAARGMAKTYGFVPPKAAAPAAAPARGYAPVPTPYQPIAERARQLSGDIATFLQAHPNVYHHPRDIKAGLQYLGDASVWARAVDLLRGHPAIAANGQTTARRYIWHTAEERRA